MQKRKLRIILFLGILLGMISNRIGQVWNNLQQPLLEQKSFSIDAIVDSFTKAINLENINLVDNRYERFDEVINLLQEAYYNKENINEIVMIDKALKSFVNALDDPYTVYLDAKQQSGFTESLKGENDFEGIGAVVSKKEYYVLIEELIKDSPAFKAGLQPLDRIIAVNSGSVKNLTINEAVNKIKGPEGSKVFLTIERVDRKNSEIKEFFDLTVQREQMLIPSVFSKIIQEENGPKIAYIEISIIGEETENLLQKEIISLKKEGFDGIIIDLRGNGGGFLPIAVDILSHFVAKDDIVVSAKYRIFNEEVYHSQGYGDLEGYPVVVLIDYMTASAGEIISLGLQEQIGAKLVGATSFGKGSIQTIEEFSNGTSLKYTIGKRYAPSGKNIDTVGIDPDIKIEFDKDAYIENNIDNQLEEAKTVLKKMIDSE